MGSLPAARSATDVLLSTRSPVSGDASLRVHTAGSSHSTVGTRIPAGAPSSSSTAAEDVDDPRSRLLGSSKSSAIATPVKIPDLPMGWSAFKHNASGALAWSWILVWDAVALNGIASVFSPDWGVHNCPLEIVSLICLVAMFAATLVVPLRVRTVVLFQSRNADDTVESPR